MHQPTDKANREHELYSLTNASSLKDKSYTCLHATTARACSLLLLLYETSAVLQLPVYDKTHLKYAAHVLTTYVITAQRLSGKQAVDDKVQLRRSYNSARLYHDVTLHLSNRIHVVTACQLTAAHEKHHGSLATNL
eukprot:15377-Heterococcus_DN1.PRE.2